MARWTHLTSRDTGPQGGGGGVRLAGQTLPWQPDYGSHNGNLVQVTCRGVSQTQTLTRSGIMQRKWTNCCQKYRINKQKYRKEDNILAMFHKIYDSLDSVNVWSKQGSIAQPCCFLAICWIDSLKHIYTVKERPNSTITILLIKYRWIFFNIVWTS